jgi:hypothetical protein
MCCLARAPFLSPEFQTWAPCAPSFSRRRSDSLRTLKGRQLPKKRLFFRFQLQPEKKAQRSFRKSIHCSSVSVLACYKIPGTTTLLSSSIPFSLCSKIKETFREKGGRRQEARRGEASLPCSASRPGSAVLPTGAHGRRGGVGSACGPAARAGAGAGGCAGGQAGEARDGAGGGLLRRLPALRRRLPSRVRPPCQATHLSPFRASPFLTPDSENQLTDRLLIASVD